jgi:hypothetical protein
MPLGASFIFYMQYDMFYIMTKGGMMQRHMHLQHIMNCILNILPLT